MRLLEHSYEAPAENLALDEVLLDDAEAGRGGETLRLWKSPVHFVVLGLSQAVDEQVLRDACKRDGIPVLRRCSAGGCVLQGPGCLNYSLILRSDRPGCESIHASYRTILSEVARVLASLGLRARPAGISDLAIEGRKISGSAQRRRHSHFLHHGTLLVGFDLALLPRYLHEPADQPEYRGRRSHESFVSNLGIEESNVIRAVSSMFQAHEIRPIQAAEHDAARRLAIDKYSRAEWTYRK